MKEPSGTRVDLEIAGKTIRNADDVLRRYLGLSWSGGPPKASVAYFRELIADPTPELIEPVDVVVALGARHSVDPYEVSGFRAAEAELNYRLSQIPADRDLDDLDVEAFDNIWGLEYVAAHSSWDLFSLSGVMSRKRPRAVPTLTRALVSWYGLKFDEWFELLEALRDDVSDGRNGRALNTLAEEYAIYFGTTPISKLRLLEIAVAVVSGLLDQDDDLAESTEERPEIPQANNQTN